LSVSDCCYFDLTNRKYCSGQVPEPNQSAESAIAVVMPGESTPAEETPEESRPAKRLPKAACVALKQQAQRVLVRSNKTLPAVTEGDNVAVPVSDFDRSKGDPPNVIGVALAVGKSGYTIGTKQGIIKGRLARNQKYSRLATENVSNTESTVREIVRAQSVCGWQGYHKPACRGPV